MAPPSPAAAAAVQPPPSPSAPAALGPLQGPSVSPDPTLPAAEQGAPLSQTAMLDTAADASPRSTPPMAAPRPPPNEHRLRVVQEIVSSERVYNSLLQDFLQVYLLAMQTGREAPAQAFMASAPLVSLCTNLEQLSLVAEQLLSELQREVESAAEADEDPEVGEIFLSLSSLFKLYGQYAENHAAARHEIKRMVEDPAFRVLWDRTETNAMLGRGPTKDTPRMPGTSTSLDGYLILPIQRVPRYLLLLKEVLKATPEDGVLSNEHENLTKALNEVQNAARFMNDCIWRSEQKEILRELQSRFVGAVVDFIGGVGPAGYRALVHEGPLVRVTRNGGHREYHFHLLNDALIYSRATADGRFKLHRALTITKSSKVEDAPAPLHPAYDEYVLAAGRQRHVSVVERLGTSRAPPVARAPGAPSRAFKIETPDKSFVVYASSLEIKRVWMEKINQVIADLAALGATDEAEEQAPVLQRATTDRCQMCRNQLRLFQSKFNCERCGLLVCASCGSNHRVLPHSSSKSVVPVCCACAWEMDGTAVDTHPDEFRLKMWVDDVQSLVGGVGGHALLDPSGARNSDAVEALKRIYFSVTTTAQNDEKMTRGPSNAGALGVDAAFSVPIGVPSESPPHPITVHMHVVGVGEVGSVQVHPETLVLEKDVARGQQSYKWFVVSKTPGNAAVSTLAVTLVQPSKREVFAHRSLSDKERGALRIGLKICFELHVPPALWSLHFLDPRRGTEVHVTSSRPGSIGAALAARRTDDVASRLQRYVHLDDTSNAVGCGRVEDQGRKLNASLLSDYERRARSFPTPWGVALVDILFSDCLAYFGRMTEARGSRYSDTQVSILNRLHAFHKAIGAREERTKLIEELPSATVGGTTERSANEQISRKALQAALEAERLAKADPVAQMAAANDDDDDDDDEKQDDNDDRNTILRELVESERTYLNSLIALDDVFVSRLTEVANGANIKLAVSKSNDAWASKMGLVTSKPKTTTGVQVSDSSPWKAIAKKSSFKLNEQQDPGSEAVAEILRQPAFTVLLQSVRQIRTVNEEFLSSLSKAVAEHLPVGGVLERFAGVMPVYSTYATHHPFVLEQLSSHRTDDTASTSSKRHELDELLTACELDPRCMGLHMRELMNLPLERVETYRSVLSALLMVTPQTNPDWDSMRIALGRIVESTKSISRAIRKKENAMLLRGIAQSVEGWPVGFEVEDNERWFVREGPLVERGDDGRVKLRYFWLFSDCIVMATKNPSSALSLRVSGGAPKQYRFRRLIRIAEMTLCDLPHGIQHKGAVLGDPAFAFCIACISGPSFVAMVPNNASDCLSKCGPAPVELARIGPPSAYRFDTGDSRGRAQVVYHKVNVKQAWLSDILLCIEMHQRGAVFDTDDGLLFAKHVDSPVIAERENSGKVFNRSPATTPGSTPPVRTSKVPSSSPSGVQQLSDARQALPSPRAASSASGNNLADSSVRSKEFLPAFEELEAEVEAETVETERF